MALRFGVTGLFIREMAVLALALAAVTSVSSMIILLLSNAGLMTALGLLILLGTLVISVVAAATAVIAGFSVQVSERNVQRLLWGRFAMSEYLLTDFVDADEERCVLHFSDRQRLRLAGMHRGEITRLAEFMRAHQKAVATRPDTLLERARGE